MRPLFIALLIILIIGIAISPCAAITREAAIEFALENTEAVRIAEERAASLRAQGRSATAFSLPQLDLSANYLEMGDNADDPDLDIPGFTTPEGEVAAELTASQTLYAGGRIYNSWRLRGNLRRQADLSYQSGVRDVKIAVKSAFDTVLLQRAFLTILKDRVAQRTDELGDATDLWNAGVVTSLDVRQARLNLNFSDTELQAGEADYMASLIDFNVAIGRKGIGFLWSPEGDLATAPKSQALTTRLEEALDRETLLDLNFREALAEAGRMSYRIARGEGLPRVSLVASARTGGEEIDDRDESWSVGLRMDWSLLDGGRVNAGAAAALSDARIAENELSQTRKDISGRIEKIGINLASLEKRIALQRESVTLSRENYDDARGQYRAGTITQVRLGEFNLSYAEARFTLQRLLFLRREVVSAAESLLEGVE